MRKNSFVERVALFPNFLDRHDVYKITHVRNILENRKRCSYFHRYPRFFRTGRAPRIKCNSCMFCTLECFDVSADTCESDARKLFAQLGRFRDHQMRFEAHALWYPWCGALE